MWTRLTLLALACFTLSACLNIKKDPNLPELTSSAERQNDQVLAHERLLAEQRQKDEAECMKASTEGAMAICFLGKTATTLAHSRGGSGSASLQPTLPNYSPPPTPLQQLGQFAQAVTPFAQGVIAGVVSFDATRQANQTTRVVSGHNTAREVATVQAIANQPPGIQLGEGAVYSAAGPVTQIGGNSAGGHYNESGTLIADSTDATLGVRQGDNAVNGDNNLVRYQSPDVINSGNCTAGNGAPGAAGAAGGAGGLSSGASGGTGGAGAPGGNGGAGGAGGNCTPAPLPIVVVPVLTPSPPPIEAPTPAPPPPTSP